MFCKAASGNFTAWLHTDTEVLQFEIRLSVRLKAVFPRVEAFDAAAAHHTGFVRAFLANLKPNAQPIGAYDVLLAGYALALGAVFVTNNVKEFSRVPGLVVENWQSRWETAFPSNSTVAIRAIRGRSFPALKHRPSRRRPQRRRELVPGAPTRD